MSRQARLGLVVLLAILSAVVFMFVIASQSNLLADTFRVRASFNRVAGLQAGADVFYNGISVGRVEKVMLPRAPGDPIEVLMAVDEEARPLIREDSKALVQTDGLVGNVIVSLTDGSPNSPEVGENGRIQGVDPFDIAQVSDRLFQSVSRFDSVSIALSGIINDTRSGEGTLGRFLYDEQLYDATVGATQEFQVLLRGFSGRADALLAIAEDASAGVDQILAKVNNGNGTVARFLNEDGVYTTALSTVAQLQEGAAQLQTVSADIREITDRFAGAAGWASLGAFRFSELMEAGKHNFLFRSYFEDRGYFEMAPFEVRERAIAETLSDLQEWERRLYRQQQQIDAALQDLERRGIVAPPPAGAARGDGSRPTPRGPQASAPPAPVPPSLGVGPLLRSAW